MSYWPLILFLWLYFAIEIRAYDARDKYILLFFFFFFQKYEINNIKHIFAFCWVVGNWHSLYVA